MLKTFNKHIKWREDRKGLLICDCKRLIDMVLPLKYLNTIKKFHEGVEEDDLFGEEGLILSDFKKMNFLANLEVRQIKKEEFEDAMKILDNELGKNRVRSKEFLREKFNEDSELFIGVFLDQEMIGFICGFPREDYFLLSEIAIDIRFQGRSFGKKLINLFELIAKKKGFRKFQAGSEDHAIGFYYSLGYEPFLLIQYKKLYNENSFKGMDIFDKKIFGEYDALYVNVKKKDVKKETLIKLREKYPEASFQYIFTKNFIK
jgi:ribosomal protein S18 acetylase RimI-like enzyme